MTSRLPFSAYPSVKKKKNKYKNHFLTCSSYSLLITWPKKVAWCLRILFTKYVIVSASRNSGVHEISRIFSYEPHFCWRQFLLKLLRTCPGLAFNHSLILIRMGSIENSREIGHLGTTGVIQEKRRREKPFLDGRTKLNIKSAKSMLS